MKVKGKHNFKIKPQYDGTDLITDTDVGSNSDVAANTAAKHTHSNSTQLDLLTDGDHDVRTDNPHSVTTTQLSLNNVTNDAQLKRSANDISTFTEKVSPVDADLLLIEDSAASGVKKKVQISNLPARIPAIELSWGEELHDMTGDSSEWSKAAGFIFRGTNAIGDVLGIKSVVWQTSTNCTLRIRDVTNSQTICTSSAFTNTEPAIVSLGSISNAPTGEAIWELQYLENGSGKIYIDALSIQF